MRSWIGQRVSERGKTSQDQPYTHNVNTILNAKCDTEMYFHRELINSPGSRPRRRFCLRLSRNSALIEKHLWVREMVCVCVCMLCQIQTSTHTHTHTCIRMHTHTHTHTHTQPGEFLIHKSLNGLWQLFMFKFAVPRRSSDVCYATHTPRTSGYHLVKSLFHIRKYRLISVDGMV